MLGATCTSVSRCTQCVGGVSAARGSAGWQRRERRRAAAPMAPHLAGELMLGDDKDGGEVVEDGEHLGGAGGSGSGAGIGDSAWPRGAAPLPPLPPPPAGAGAPPARLGARLRKVGSLDRGGGVQLREGARQVGQKVGALGLHHCVGAAWGGGGAGGGTPSGGVAPMRWWAPAGAAALAGCVCEGGAVWGGTSAERRQRERGGKRGGAAAAAAIAGRTRRYRGSATACCCSCCCCSLPLPPANPTVECVRSLTRGWGGGGLPSWAQVQSGAKGSGSESG